jgi:hypothetical protein
MHCAKCFFYESDVGDEVCNRCGRAYLPEANVYLGLLLLVTGGTAWTLRNLLTGEADSFIRPALDLGAWVTWPVSIVDRPAYGFVIGMWLAMLAAAPILTGIMYGKRGGWLLAIAIALLGPSLVLSAVTALGVWIAAGWTLRLGSKFVSALMGLAPVAVYWFVATALTDFGKGEPQPAPDATLLAVPAIAAKTLAPALKSLAYVAPVTAAVTAVLAALAVVGAGTADRWHVRWPAAALAVLVAGPVMALPALVGIDEIRYGFLREPLAPRAVGLAAQPSEIDLFQEFLGRCPTGPRAAEVRAHLAADVEQVENGTRAGTVTRGSRDIWQGLLQQHPKSVWAADARLHLGDDAARQGLFDEAERFYREVLDQTAKIEAPKEDPLATFTVVWDLFSIGPDLRAKENAEHLRAVRRDTLMRMGLIADNRQGTPDSGRALALYFTALGLKGTNRYRERLQAAAETDPRGPIVGNVAYELAMFEPDRLKRIGALRQVIAAYPRTDEAMLANLSAARALIARAAADPAAMREAKQHLVEVQTDLTRRSLLNPDDPYVAALADAVEKELVYVQAQLRTPEKKAR